jgi:hypothetical protein
MSLVFGNNKEATNNNNNNQQTTSSRSLIPFIQNVLFHPRLNSLLHSKQVNTVVMVITVGILAIIYFFSVSVCVTENKPYAPTSRDADCGWIYLLPDTNQYSVSVSPTNNGSKIENFGFLNRYFNLLPHTDASSFEVAKRAIPRVPTNVLGTCVSSSPDWECVSGQLRTKNTTVSHEFSYMVLYYENSGNPQLFGHLTNFCPGGDMVCFPSYFNNMLDENWESFWNFEINQLPLRMCRVVTCPSLAIQFGALLGYGELVYLAATIVSGTLLRVVHPSWLEMKKGSGESGDVGFLASGV